MALSLVAVAAGKDDASLNKGGRGKHCKNALKYESEYTRKFACSITETLQVDQAAVEVGVLTT